MLPEKEFPVNDPTAEGSEEKTIPQKPEDDVTPAGNPLVDSDESIGRNGDLISDEDSDTSPRNIFSDPTVAAHYVSVYEKAHYECRHVFDPTLAWTKKEEKTVIRKLDWHGKTSGKLLEDDSASEVKNAYLPCSLHLGLCNVLRITN